MAKQKEKEIDVSSLDSELSAAKALEEGKGNIFITIASVVGVIMCLFHIYTGFVGPFDYVTQRGIHLGFGMTIILLTQPLYKHMFKDKYADREMVKITGRVIDMILIVLTWVSILMAMSEVHHMRERLSNTTWMAVFAGIVLTVIIMECARRTLRG